MSDDTSLPGVPDNADQIYSGLRRAIGDLDLTQSERDAIGSYVGQEVNILLDTSVTSYLVLGSYRDQCHKRLRAVAHELNNRRTDTRAVVLGDTVELDVSERELPAFSVKFNLLATAADYVVMVMEKESGGEGVELGRIADMPYFVSSHVLPRDYANFVSDAITSLADAKKSALELWFNHNLTDTEKSDAIAELAAKVPMDTTDVTSETDIETIIKDFVTERAADDEPPAAYSWVHLSDFRKFERAGRCYPWQTEDMLRQQAHELPGPPTVDTSFESVQSE